MGYRNLFIALLVATVAYAFRIGGRPERWAAAMFVIAGLLTLLLHSPWPVRYVGVETSVLVVDAALLIALLALALHADRFWPLAMAALQTMAIAAHAAKALDLRLGAGAYQQALVFWSYATLPLLALAVWRHGRRSARGGGDRDWSIYREHPDQGASETP
ncbi:hypothetical protein [Sphingomonas faeni]|uniref:hypothetical protein n=1 Tax=Sphingomonas faeni TaxID=185950 RepID=UPI00334B9722